MKNDNKDFSTVKAESDAIAKIAKWKLIKQCVGVAGIIGVTIFAAMFFNEPKMLWLLFLLVFVY